MAVDRLDTEIAAFVRLLDLRRGHVARHSERVTELAVAVGRRLGLSAPRLATLEKAARLLDLGKIGVPDRILGKEGPLDAEEWAIMRCHPVWGAEALAGVRGLEEVATVVRFHHERWDGRGYPDGLKGEDIPRESRIAGACDAFCSITADRPYRDALSRDQALDLLGAAAGIAKARRPKAAQQFDSDVVEALSAVLEERPELSAAAGAKPRARRPSRTPAADRRKGGWAAAIEAVGDLPALAESRKRLLRLLAEPNPPAGQIADVIEADPGMTASVLRADTVTNGARAAVIDVPGAVLALGNDALRDIAERVRVFDFFQQVAGYRIPPERFRLHAVATRRAACRIGVAVRHDAPGALAAAALLHDVGKLVLAEGDVTYPTDIHGSARTPQQRVEAERRALGTDHAAVGALVLRRWGLPERVIAAVSGHHDADGEHDARVLGLADMLAHYAAGTPVDPSELLQAGSAMAISADDLRAMMFDLQSSPASRPDHIEPCPLGRAELAVLRGVSDGKRNKAIALERGVSASTVRSHLHSAYRKLEVNDRAQAVLLATARGWL
jgi:putative nucleotidyltransferase with HDIG domain